jgi:hypothetical protein
MVSAFLKINLSFRAVFKIKYSKGGYSGTGKNYQKNYKAAIRN